MRHDSGMSDSQFIKFQNTAKEKMNKYVAKFDNENTIRLLKQRFEYSKNRKLTLWEKIKVFFHVN